MNDISVMIADDHPLIIEGVASVLTRHQVNMVGSERDPDQVVATYLTLKPDVLVLGLRFGRGGSGGLDILSALMQRAPAARVLIFTEVDHDTVIREAYKRGAKAFVPKRADPDELVQAILKTAKGETVFLPEIAGRLAMLSVRGDASPLAKLLPRELEVFKLMALGLTNVEIAERLALSPKTISTTSQSIKDQLGIHRAAGLTLLAVRQGVIDP